MYQRILVPIDCSGVAARGLDEAVRLAKLTGASLRLVHVVEVIDFATCLEPAAAYSNDVAAGMIHAGERTLEGARFHAAVSGVAVDTVLLDNRAGRVSQQVIEQAKAWSADLIVIGTHGRRGVGRWMLGSEAEEIARMAPVPVLLVRGSTLADEEAETAAAREAAASSPTAMAS